MPFLSPHIPCPSTSPAHPLPRQAKTNSRSRLPARPRALLRSLHDSEAGTTTTTNTNTSHGGDKTLQVSSISPSRQAQ
ncbi:hypothetical protein O3P69_012879 [Scylla paramamosain]|uniref:Uncharacterized protein n=1 Tax=Scylla paramamosain TaxID=85552 RepID=A0AAW0TR34_SCYPA